MSMRTDDDETQRMASIALFLALIVTTVASAVFVWLVCTWIGLGFPWRDVVALVWTVGYAIREQREMEAAGWIWPWDERYRRR